MKLLSRWAALAVLAIAIFITYRTLTPTDRSSNKVSTEVAVEKPRTRSAVSATDHDSPASRSAGKMIESDWDELLAWLGTDPQPGEPEIRARLLELRTKWAEMDPILVAETIDRLLATNRDAATAMKFQVGLHGFLDGWPTLRVFLLDALVVADAETAAPIARDILATTDSAEEYAVALRSLTRDQAMNSSEAELLDRFHHALEKPEWQTSPGFAESLDLARTIGTGGAAEQLLQWDGNPALKAMALHEFAADHPAEMMAALESDLPLDPVVRADLMARLDPAKPDQAAALDRFLRDPQRTATDTIAFLKSFPLRSATTGDRLYSPAPAPYEIKQIAAGDQAALTLVNRWLTDPALESTRPDLLALQSRLTAWVEQAK